MSPKAEPQMKGKETEKPSVRQILDATMFELSDHTAKLSNLNTRAEKHGEKTKPAADIKFEVIGDSSLLSYFGESFREFLFREPGVGENRVAYLNLGDDKRTKLRNPEVAQVPLNLEYDGYSAVISVGLKTGKPVELSDCRVRGFSIQALDGGAVKISFTVTGYPDKAQIGSLFEWQKRDVDLTLSRPKADIEQRKVDGTTTH